MSLPQLPDRTLIVIKLYIQTNKDDTTVTIPLTRTEDGRDGDVQNGHAREDEGKETDPKSETSWKDLSFFEKVLHMIKWCGEISALFLCLYVFICSLGILEDSFKLLGGKTAGETFRNNKLLSNPLAGLMIGVLATVLVQSSSTSSSIVVTLVGSEVIPIQTAIPIIMGVNIGTSVTNTVVSMAQSGDRHEYRRAFAGATVHDMFNWLTVIVLLPLELATGYLYHLTKAIADRVRVSTMNQKQGFLKTITKPVTDHIIMVEHGAISDAALGRNSSNSGSLTMRWCEQVTYTKNVTTTHSQFVPLDCSDDQLTPLLRSACQHLNANGSRELSVSISWNVTNSVNVTENIRRCDHMFASSNLSDTAIGVILLLLSLVLIFGALFFIVKILHVMLKGSVADIIKKTVNADFPGRAACFTGYIAILIGCGLTIVIQSSSVFTSTLTPLVGVGMVSIERMYPMTLGSNIGTTVTGILAALSTEKEHLADAFQIAMCHLFYNLSGVLLFYPIPATRIPIKAAKFLGETTARHRWFAGFYLIMMFLVVPGAVFALSYAGTVYIVTVGSIVLVVVLLILLVNILQQRFPSVLPERMRDWNFLPYQLRTLSVLDTIVKEIFLCDCCRKLKHSQHKPSAEIHKKTTCL